MYCPKPDQLNDPLEGLLGHHIEGAEGGKPLDEQLRAGFVSMIETDRDLAKARVCCFSARPDSMQMWSYYAGGQKGLCLEVDVSGSDSRIIKIEYVDDMAALKTKSPVERLAFKHSTWKHEQEYRLIMVDEPKHKFLAIKINSVLISASTDPSFSLPLSELCRHLGLPRELATFSTLGEFRRFRLRPDVPFYERLRAKDK